MKKRAKSLIGFSVIAKSKEFFHKTQEKNNQDTEEVHNHNGKILEKQISDSSQRDNNFAEFTFASSPSERNIKKIDTTGKYMKDEISTPQSVETYADSVDQKPQKSANRCLAPYQVKVSFDCGIDLEKFLRRAG